MPNIRSQKVDASPYTVVASDGRTYSVTDAQIRTYWQAQSGSAASKKSKTIQWIKDSMVAALGAEQVDALLLDLDADSLGKFSRFVVKG